MTALSASMAISSAPTRFLVLKLSSTSIQTQKRLNAQLAEAFLFLSPQVQFRAPHFIFAEISSTAHLHGGEKALTEKTLAIAKKFGFETRIAVGDTLAGTQVFSEVSSTAIFICPLGEEGRVLKTLPLSALLHLEGLTPWSERRKIETIVQFMHSIGFGHIQDILSLPADSFQSRWGDLGKTLWRRLHQQDVQRLSPLLPPDALKDYIHLDNPLSIVSLILYQLEKSLSYLFQCLENRALFLQKLVLHLHCEYSNKKHSVEIHPYRPGRDLDLLLKLTTQRLEQVCLENPIRAIELEVVSVPEKVVQTDFFEVRDLREERMEKLLAHLHQADIPCGTLQTQAAIWPEQAQTWGALHSNSPASVGPPKVSYGKNIQSAPRPALLCARPLRIARDEQPRWRLLSKQPIERIESSWWQGKVTPNFPQNLSRDYYFALSTEGQCAWIFQEGDEFYVHGYFD